MPTEMTNYMSYIATSRYARYLPDEGRRETWEETVERICAFWRQCIEESALSPEDKTKALEELG